VHSGSPEIRVLSIPAEHPYTQAIRPVNVAYLPDPNIDGNWWPHPAFTAEYWRAIPPQEYPAVMHVHFGFEHFTPAQIRELVDVLPVPLVVTAHDIENPHLADAQGQRDHQERLQILLDAADAVLTLTDCAAATLRDAFGVAHVDVVKHPALASPVDADRAPRAAVFVKSLRGNVVADPQFYRDISGRVPLDVYVHDVPATAELRAALPEAHVHAPMSDAELHAAIAGVTTCILPYTRGTHSGWLELCRDLGTTIAVPDIGCYADQADTDAAVAVYAAGDGQAAGEAAAHLVARGAVAYVGDRARELEEVRATHADIYSRLAQGGHHA